MKRRSRRVQSLAGRAILVLAAGMLGACDRAPEPIRKLVEPTPRVDPAGEPVRITLRDKVLTLGCVTSASGHCNFLLISHAPNRIEAFSVAQGQGRDIERVGREAFYCVDMLHSPEIDKCTHHKLWASLDTPPDK